MLPHSYRDVLCYLIWRGHFWHPIWIFATFWISPALWRFSPKSPISPKSPVSKGPLTVSNSNRHFRHCMDFITVPRPPSYVYLIPSYQACLVFACTWSLAFLFLILPARKSSPSYNRPYCTLGAVYWWPFSFHLRHVRPCSRCGLHTHSLR